MGGYEQGGAQVKRELKSMFGDRPALIKVKGQFIFSPDPSK